MTAVIELLSEKNNCLEKFYRLNEAELENFAVGNFDGLEAFYTTREGILELVAKIDEIIEKSNEFPVDASQISDDVKKAIMLSLQYKNDLVTRILEQDLKILSAIESAKSQVIKELSQVRTGRKALGSYKSGEKDSNLDEEA